MAYYGIFIPNELKTNPDDEYVFDDKGDAFQMLKRHRESRLKSFKTREEAETFAICGRENLSNSIFSPNGSDSRNGNNAIDLVNDASQNSTKSGSSPLVGEKPSSYRCPISQELVKFRKSIEQGNYDLVYTTVWANPRYLIGSGDTPTILKESFRYNALHVAALARNAQMCSLLLETVSDPQFILLMYGKDNQKTAEEVAKILLDLYLNMPEKGRNETPLHLAVKFGAVEVVEMLTSYKECQMNRNSDGLLPKDMICSRIDSAGEDKKNAIKNLLQERFYVPVIRSVDNSTPPIIGELFSPTQSILSCIDPLSPEMEIKAIAGPMNKDQAETFRKRWKTPPRITHSSSFITSPPSPSSASNGSPLSSYPNSIVRNRCTPNKINQSLIISSPSQPINKTPRRLFDLDNAENENDNLAKENISKENGTNFEVVTPIKDPSKKNSFLNYRERLLNDRFNDSLDDSTASLHNNSLNESIIETPGFKERNLKLADVDKGLEVIGRGLAKDQNVGWMEYWSFMGEFVNIGTVTGLIKFENYLQQKIDAKMKPPALPIQKLSKAEKISVTVESSPMSTMCQSFNKFKLTRESNGLKLSPFEGHDQNQYQQQQQQSQQLRSSSTPSSPSAFHAYLCVEKSWQVYAKRLLKPITQQPTNIVMINDTLCSELNRLKSLVCSYKEDLRFFGIEFRASHSRFAHIIVSLLNEADVNANEKKCIDDFTNCLKQILQAKEKANNNITNTNNNNNGHAESISNTKQLICLIGFLLKRLADKNHLISPEILTTERDCVDAWCAEEKCDCEWINSINKINRNIKRRHELNHECDQIQSQPLMGNDEADNSDDELYMSLSESDDENDEFFTPPETPTPSFYEIIEKFNKYTNYIFGEEPTKMDNDVMRALHYIEIDKNTFPNVHKWHTALLNYTPEERNNFPPLLNRRNIKPTERNKVKRLFQSPVREVLPKLAQFQLKPSILNNKY